MVQKLSGFAKFDVDYKIGKYQFFHLCEEASKVEDQNAETPIVEEGAEQDGDPPQKPKIFDPELYDRISDAFKTALDETNPAVPF